jgi:Mitochondrial K+-H+ exchange-related
VQLSPFPNVTLYYTVYKLWSHWQAALGCSTMHQAFRSLDRVQLSVAEEVKQNGKRHKQQALHNAVASEQLIPTFVPSKDLDRLVRPLER